MLRKGKRSERFTLAVYGLPANSSFTLHVNGNPLLTAQSNKRGSLMVRALPASLLTVASVRLVDEQGAEAASANF